MHRRAGLSAVIALRQQSLHDRDTTQPWLASYILNWRDRILIQSVETDILRLALILVLDMDRPANVGLVRPRRLWLITPSLAVHDTKDTGRLQCTGSEFADLASLPPPSGGWDEALIDWQVTATS